MSGNTVASACGGTFTHSLFDAGMDTPPQLTAGPYPELGKGTDLVAEAKSYGEQALGKAGELAADGKQVASDAIASLGKVVGDTAPQIGTI